MPITGHRKFGLRDWGANTEIDVETNWNTTVSDNKYLRFSLGKEEVIIEMDELRSLLIMLLPIDKSMDVMDNKIKTVHYYDVPVTLTLPRDGRKGEKFKSIVNIPVWKS